MSDVIVREEIEIERVRFDQLNLDPVTARIHDDRNIEIIAAWRWRQLVALRDEPGGLGRNDAPVNFTDWLFVHIKSSHFGKIEWQNQKLLLSAR